MVKKGHEFLYDDQNPQYDNYSRSSKQHRDTAISDLRRIGILRKPLFIRDKID